MAKHPWLSLHRLPVYWFRAKVPKDIITTFGKSEVVFSLKTKDRREADRLVNLRAAEIQASFEEHRAALVVAPVPTAATPTHDALDAAMLRRLRASRFHEVVDADFAWRRELVNNVRNDGEGFGDGKYIDHPRDDWYSFNYELLPIDDLLLICIRHEQERRLKEAERRLLLADVGSLPSEVALAEGLSLFEGDLGRLGRTLLEVEVDARKVILESDHERYQRILERYQPSQVLVPPQAPETRPTTAEGDPGPILSSIVAPYVAERNSEGKSHKTRGDDDRFVREFVQVVGDKPIREYAKADAVKFKAVLVRMPASRLAKTYKDLSPSEAAALADELKEPHRLHTETVNNKIMSLGRVFKWAHDQYGDENSPVDNPFKGLRIKTQKQRGKRSKARYPFSPAELKALFNGTIYRGCRSKHFWKQQGSLIPRDSARFWAPLIAMYSGMRCGEIIQLRTSDIKTDDEGIIYFDVTTLLEAEDDDDPKSLKTTTSERQIPVHPMLLKCGLMDLYAQRVSEKSMRMFPDYKRAADESWSKTFGAWFRDYRDACGVNRVVDGKNVVVFHSFRHLFEDKARNLNGVDWDVRNAIQGHGEGGVSEEYGTGFYRETLKRAIDKIEYDGLDLSHLLVKPVEANTVSVQSGLMPSAI